MQLLHREPSATANCDMAIQKIKGVVLRVQPYRETSALLRLFAEQTGLVHCIAKGIRGKKPRQTILERGVVVEGLLYVKPNRDLFTLGSVQLLEFFPGIRSSLIRSSLRDAAFEMILRTITQSDPHPELYTLFSEFLCRLENRPAHRGSYASLWEFYFSYSRLLGFALNIQTCLECGQPLGSEQGGLLSQRRGGLRCGKCAQGYPRGYHIPGYILAFFATGDDDHLKPVTDNEAGRISRILAEYCSYHFDVNPRYSSLDFLDTLPINESPVAPR